MPEKKPHILLLIDDEHRPDVMPIEGNPHIRTPTLDRFIEQGTYFRNAYTPSPICVPARQSFLSGLYPRNTGCTDFGTEATASYSTAAGGSDRFAFVFGFNFGSCWRRSCSARWASAEETETA